MNHEREFERLNTMNGCSGTPTNSSNYDRSEEDLFHSELTSSSSPGLPLPPTSTVRSSENIFDDDLPSSSWQDQLLRNSSPRQSVRNLPTNNVDTISRSRSTNTSTSMARLRSNGTTNSIPRVPLPQTPMSSPRFTFRRELIRDASDSSMLSNVTSISHFNKQISQSALHDAARIRNWDRVRELCETNPELARYKSHERWTALHHACDRRPPHDVVKKLILAYPDALLARDREKGWTPLHHACRFKASVEVIHHFLYLSPNRAKKAASIKGNGGRTPIFFAIRYDAPDGVVEKLLDVDTSGILAEDYRGSSALTLVWDNFIHTKKGKEIVEKWKKMVIENKRIEFITGTDIQERWKMADKLISCAFRQHNSRQNNERNERLKQDTDKSSDDWKILHAVCSIRCHPTLFYIAKGLYPEQIEQVDSCTGRTALHCAAISPAGSELAVIVTNTILNIWSESTKVQDKDGSLPLHLAVENTKKTHWSKDAVASIFSAYPDSIKVKDNSGRLPLHRAGIAIAYRPDTESVMGDNNNSELRENNITLKLLLSYKEAACVKDKNGQTPFHVFAAHGVTWDTATSAVYEAFPEAIQHRDEEGRLPIHLASQNPENNPDLIRKLLELHPRGASMPDKEGKLPFHLACEAGKSWCLGGLKEIHDKFMRAKDMKDQTHKGWTPLHYAAASPNASGQLIEKLISLAPSTVNELDNMGRYPLHLACASGKSWSGGIEKLISMNRDALEKVDCFGLFPLHATVLGGAKVMSMSPEVEDDHHHADDGSSDGNDNNNLTLNRSFSNVSEMSADGEQQNGIGDDNNISRYIDSPEDLARIHTIFELLMGDPHAVWNYYIPNP